MHFSFDLTPRREVKTVIVFPSLPFRDLIQTKIVSFELSVRLFLTEQMFNALLDRTDPAAVHQCIRNRFQQSFLCEIADCRPISFLRMAVYIMK